MRYRLLTFHIDFDVKVPLALRGLADACSMQGEEMIFPLADGTDWVRPRACLGTTDSALSAIYVKPPYTTYGHCGDLTT